MGSVGDDDLLDFQDLYNDGDEADFFPSLPRTQQPLQPTQRNLNSQPTQARDPSSSQLSFTSGYTPSKHSSVAVRSSNAPYLFINNQQTMAPQPRAVPKRPERPKMKPLYDYETPGEDVSLQPEWEEISRADPNESKNNEYESDLNLDSFSFDFKEKDNHKEHQNYNPSREDYRTPSSLSVLPSRANSFRNISGQQVLPRSSSNNSVCRQTQLDQYFPTRSSLGILGSGSSDSGGSKRKMSVIEDDLYYDDNLEKLNYNDFSSQQRPVVPRQKIVKANPPPSSQSQHQVQSQCHSPLPSYLPNARGKHPSLVGEPYNSVFWFETFNMMQSESFHDVFETDDNIVISGKFSF
jgi:hypothetical protein